MKVPTKEIDKFIVNIPAEIKSILIYGPDMGQVKQNAALIAKNRILAGKYKYEEIKGSPYQVIDILASISLFNDNIKCEKIAYVEFSSSGLSEPLLSIVKNATFKGKLIFLAGELGTDSVLRKTFEAGQNTAAIACYADDQLSIKNLIEQFFKKNSISFEQGAIQMLSNSLNVGNREFMVRELEKIFLFLGNRKHVMLADLSSYFDSLGGVSFEKLCYDLSLKKVHNIERILQQLQKDGHNLVSIVRIVGAHFNRIYQARLILEQTKDQERALKSLTPPVFFKNLNDFSQSLKLWNSFELKKFIAKLNELELNVKKYPAISNIVINHVFIQNCF